MSARAAEQSQLIYTRQLPGGGFVVIDVAPTRNVLGRRRYLGCVVVERRGNRDRREGHVAPTVARARAATIASVFHDLFPIAQSNIVVAARCLARETPTLASPAIQRP